MITRRRRAGSESEREPLGSTVIYNNGATSGFSTSYTVTDNNFQSPQPVFPDIDITMTCRDRTNEFITTVKSLQGLSGNGYVGRPTKAPNKERQDWAEFKQAAKLIGRDLSNTVAKLEKLTLLAKSKSLFDDKSIEIQELTYIIRQDIGSLNKQIARLQELSRARSLKSGKHMQTHSNSVVVSLQSRLATMSSDFKQVLEVRTENLKQQKSRRDQFTQGPVQSTLPSSATSGYNGSVLLNDEAASRSQGDYVISMDSAPRGGFRQQQLQLIDEQDSYLQNRAETMQNIESTVVELGSIFQQLAHMVKEQEEMVQRIDSNVESTELNVEAAHSEIVKYFQNISSNRWLMIKIFVVLLLFFIVFVVFLA